MLSPSLNTDTPASGSLSLGAAGTVKNNIISGNYSVSTERNWIGTTTAMTTNCTTSVGGISGAGNNEVPIPLFDGATYQLPIGSALIGAGDVDAWMAGAQDLARHARLREGKVDIDAFNTIARRVVPRVIYVIPVNAGATYPYGTWDTAATNFNDAISAAQPGCTIMAGDGIYALKETVNATKAVEITSANGSGSIVLHVPNADRRGVYMTAFGAAVYGTMDHCTVTACSAQEIGTAVSRIGGTIKNCIIYVSTTLMVR